MACEERDGCGAFWQFVSNVNWPSRPSPDAVEAMMRERYAVNEIAHFDAEYRRLAKRVCNTVDAYLKEKDGDVDFGGGDDHTFMDMPGELIGRGKEVYLAHCDDEEALERFGQGDVSEGFCYIFHPFDDRLRHMQAALAEGGKENNNNNNGGGGAVV